MPAYYMESNEAIKDINQNGSFEWGVLRLRMKRAIFPRSGYCLPSRSEHPQLRKASPRPSLWYIQDFLPDQKRCQWLSSPASIPFEVGKRNHQKLFGPGGITILPGLGGTAYADFTQHVGLRRQEARFLLHLQPPQRQANDYGLKDMIETSRRMRRCAEHNDPGTGIISLNAPVYGGSILAGQVNNPSTFSPPEAQQ